MRGEEAKERGAGRSEGSPSPILFGRREGENEGIILPKYSQFKWLKVRTKLTFHTLLLRNQLSLLQSAHF